MSLKVLKPRVQSISTSVTLPPAPANLTGTVSTSNGTKFVTGTGTLFTKEVQAEGYLYIASATAGKRLLQIDQVESDTRLVLREAVTETVTGQTFTQILPQYKQVLIYPSDNLGTINNVAVDTQETLLAMKSYDGHIAPFEINGTSHPFFVVTLE